MLRSEDFQEVLNDPIRLGKFLTEASEIVELDKIARKHAIAIMLRGIKVPGWILRRRENSYVLPSALSPLAKEALFTLLDAFGAISEQRYRRLCEATGIAPEPAAIIKAGTTVFLAKSN